MPSKILTINLDHHSYDIYIGGGLLARLNDYIPEEVGGRSVFIVTDKNVQQYADGVASALNDAGARVVHLHVLNPGEATKSLMHYETLCEWMLGQGVNRDSLVIALGGGVVGDITGFAAASVLRGLQFIQIPTTLLSQVDSSIGGKTGINTKHGKNLLGAFHQPIGVITDLDVLKTLPEREFKAGYAEMVKHALITDAVFFQWLERERKHIHALDEVELSEAIERACEVKAKIVESDAHEAGRRGLLNLGHTFGHAIETAAKYDGRLLHGEAVAIGCVMAFDLSYRMGLCELDDVNRVEKHLRDAGLPTRVSQISPALKTSANELLDSMSRDKKVKDGKMTFVLVNGIGEAFLSQDVNPDLVREVIIESLGEEGVVKSSAAQPTTSGAKLSANHSFMGGMKERWKSAFSSQS